MITGKEYGVTWVSIPLREFSDLHRVWLLDNVSPQGFWYNEEIIPRSADWAIRKVWGNRRIYFNDKNHAILFKLQWA